MPSYEKTVEYLDREEPTANQWRAMEGDHAWDEISDNVRKEVTSHWSSARIVHAAIRTTLYKITAQRIGKKEVKVLLEDFHHSIFDGHQSNAYECARRVTDCDMRHG